MTDKQLEDNVLAALKWEPSIDNTQVGVTVNQGIVALRGEVKTLTEKMAAERVALRVYAVTPTVSNGWVTLKGELDWNYQREAAARAVHDLLGVRGVTNEIGIRPRVSVADVQSKIEAALKRSAEVDARRIHVGATDGQVILTGSVRSWAERVEVERAAWAAPGVRAVDDRLCIAP